MSSASRNLIAFCRGDSPDMYGRLLGDMWDWSDHKLEITHDYIQWMFPTVERSYANPLAPHLEAEDVSQFGGDEEIRQNMRLSFRRILRFYGMEWADSGEPKVLRTRFFAERKQKWFWKRNHNFYRITRILKSLRLAGLDIEARAFFKALSALYREEPSTVGSETFSFWKDAAGPAEQTKT